MPETKTGVDEVDNEPVPRIPLLKQDLIVEDPWTRFPARTHTRHNYAVTATQDGLVTLVTFQSACMGITLLCNPESGHVYVKWADQPTRRQGVAEPIILSGHIEAGDRILEAAGLDL